LGGLPSLLQRFLDPVGVAGGAEGWSHVLANAIVTLLLLLGLVVLRRVVLRFVDPRVEDARTRYQWAKVTSNVASVLGVLVVVAIWLTGLRSLGTFLGLLSAGLAIALKDVVADLAAWLFIVVRRPFEVGDRVQLGTHAGDVVNQSIFQFTLLEIGNWVEADQSTGRVVHVPNALVFTVPLANYTQEFEYIWNEIGVTISFESDWHRARALLGEIAAERAALHGRAAQQQIRRATRKFFIHYAHTAPAVYTEIREHGVRLTLRYLCPARARRSTAADLYEAILDAMAADPLVQLAYPTTRVFRNIDEGKGPLREGSGPAGGPGSSGPGGPESSGSGGPESSGPGGPGSSGGPESSGSGGRDRDAHFPG
jgi:small-conductance mechanosensitive channel